MEGSSEAESASAVRKDNVADFLDSTSYTLVEDSKNRLELVTVRTDLNIVTQHQEKSCLESLPSI